jgi:hypothetical protein
VLASAAGVSTTQIRLDWVDNSNNEQGFRIYRFNGSGWTQVGQVGANITTFTDSGLQAGGQYSYLLTSYNLGGTGYSPSSVYGLTYSAAPQSGAPRFTSASPVSTSQIRLSWSDHASDEQGFAIYRRVGASWNHIGTVGANVTSYTDSGLSAGANELYYVFAFGPGYSRPSPAPLDAETLPVLPAAPVMTSAVGTSPTQVRLTWQDTSNNESGFKVFRWNGSAWAQIATLGPNTTSYTDSGRSPAVNYSYWVWAYTASADSYAPVSLWATTPVQ